MFIAIMVLCFKNYFEFVETVTKPAFILPSPIPASAIQVLLTVSADYSYCRILESLLSNGSSQQKLWKR